MRALDNLNLATTWVSVLWAGSRVRYGFAVVSWRFRALENLVQYVDTHQVLWPVHDIRLTMQLSLALKYLQSQCQLNKKPKLRSSLAES